MKAKIFLLVVILITSTMISAQPTYKKYVSCDKKVLKRIKRTMNHIRIKDYLNEGESDKLYINFMVSEQSTAEVIKIQGNDDELKKAVFDILKEHPVESENMEKGAYFTVCIKFILKPQ